jgi:hypothetical protein
MNFGGYVPVRRGILDHTMSGELSLQEFAALTTLILLADKSTGSGKINGPVLRTYLPGLSADAAKRVLHSLETKGYIFRQITPRSPLVYAYWVSKYEPTTGPHKMLQLSTEQALATQDVNSLRYVKRAPDSALGTPLESAPEGALEGAHYNKKKKEKDTHKENPLGSKNGDFQVSEIVSANVTNNVSHSVRGRDFQVSEIVRENVSDGDGARSLPAGYELREDGCVYSAVSGVRVAPNVVAAMLERGNQP